METRRRLAVRKPTDAPSEIGEFDPTWDSQTIQAAFDESTKLQPIYPEWSDAIDRKTITIFTLATAIASAGSAWVQSHTSGSAFAVICVWIAFGSWLGAVGACYASYRPCDLRISPNPHTLTDPLWIGREVRSFQYYRLRDMGREFAENRRQLNQKARWLSWAILGTIAEAAFLWLALLG
jgi:hypothetical protein